jgi:hypothetical protein
MDDVKALLALFAMAIFGNVFDKRTYMPFIHSVNGPTLKEREQQKEDDINAIPLLERRHYCYTRGLAFDLIFWFLNRFGFSKEDQEPDDAYHDILVPYTAQLGRYMVEYKCEALELEVPGACTRDDFENQVLMAIDSYNDMDDAYDNIEDSNPSFAFDFMDYKLTAYNSTQESYQPITDFFDWGKTLADDKYFAAVEGED